VQEMPRRILLVFMLLGLVSLFADVTYEGAISIRGSYLAVIGASSIIAGLMSIGGLVSYAARFLSGALGDYLRKPSVLWLLTFTGYLINVVAIPLMALTRRWEVVMALVVLERFGKGLRAPARDVILAEVSEGIGKGLGFGIHEAMDQTGAVLGPLLASLILASSNQDYARVFLTLGIPGSIAVVLVTVAWSLYPQPRSISVRKSSLGFKGLTREYYMYIAGFFFFGLGFISWDIVSYYAKSRVLLTGDFIALLYSIAMLVDGLLAIPSGILYDKIGVGSTMFAPIAAVSTGLLLPSLVDGSPIAVAVAWGFTMGLVETNMRVAIADLVPADKRAFAYGFHGLIEGLAVMLGGIVQGLLIGLNAGMLVGYIVITEILALAFFIILHRQGK